MYSFPIRVRPNKIVFRGAMLMRFLFAWGSNMNIGAKHQITYLRPGKIRAESLQGAKPAYLVIKSGRIDIHSASLPAWAVT